MHFFFPQGLHAGLVYGHDALRYGLENVLYHILSTKQLIGFAKFVFEIFKN